MPSIVEVRDEIKTLLKNLPTSKRISSSAYDTAWVARIEGTDGKPEFPKALNWLISNQNHDGSWGETQSNFVSDRIINTLSVIYTLKKWNYSTEIVNKGMSYVEQNMQDINTEDFRPVAFEFTLPTLINELGLPDSFIPPSILKENQLKLEIIKNVLPIFKHKTTVLHSLEALPAFKDKAGDFSNLIDSNGGMLSSPSSTAYYYIQTKDDRALKFLKDVQLEDGSFPVNFPIDIFEINWILEILRKLKLIEEFKDEVSSLVEILKTNWTNNGMSWSSQFKLPDLDDTAVAFSFINENNPEKDFSVFERFFHNGVFLCFPGELKGSPSHLIHLYEVLDDGKHTEWKKLLVNQINDYFDKSLQDKWHISPFYNLYLLTNHWEILTDKNKESFINILSSIYYPNDGGWGLSSASLEETCYTLIFLSGNPRLLGENDLKRKFDLGVEYIRNNYNIPLSNQPNLWLDKVLYNPYNITQVLILSTYIKLCSNPTQK